ncbi:MAG: hypothetical protein QM755_23705 [Luteolibacter sp.]
MSVFYDTCDQIAKVLRDSGRFGTIAIHVDRQRDFESELEKVVGQSVGNLILVTWSGTDRGDRNATGPRFNGVFTITVWSKPIISGDDMAADEVVQLVCQILDDYRPLVNGRETHLQDRWVVQGAAILQHPSLLVHRIPVQLPVQIPKLQTP